MTALTISTPFPELTFQCSICDIQMLTRICHDGVGDTDRATTRGKHDSAFGTSARAEFALTMVAGFGIPVAAAMIAHLLESETLLIGVDD